MAGDGNKKKKIVRINLGFSWFYILLIGGIIWMLFSQKGANPQKIEWAEVEQIIRDGDVKEIRFIRGREKGWETYITPSEKTLSTFKIIKNCCKISKK